MQHWKLWLIALSGALVRSVATQLSSRLREDTHAQLAVAPREVACEASDERRTEAQRWLEPARRKDEHVEPKPASLPGPTAAAVLGTLGAQNPLAMLTFEQRRTLLRHKYGALFRELELSADEIERLLGALRDQENRHLSRAHSDRAGYARVDEAEAERARAEIASAIGNSKGAAFEQLKATLPARLELRRVRDQLEEAGEPMTAEQQRALVDSVSAQGPDDPPSPGDNEPLDEAMARYRAWISERDRSVRQSAAKVLSPAQLKTMDDSRQIREAMRPQLGAAPRGMRAQAGSGG